MNRDGNCTSLWQDSTPSFDLSYELKGNEEFDVLIVGAGITGITTGLLLQKAGTKCIIAEARNLCFGTTGGTTAHLNTFLDTSYDQIIKKFSEEDAKLVAQSAKAAINLIKQNIKEFSIDCAFEEAPGYLFSINEDQSKELEKLVEAANKVGVQMEFTDKSAFPLPFLKIAYIPDQAKFHPGLYLSALAKEFVRSGGVIMENCRVTNVKEDSPLVAETSAGKIKARKVIYATHIPPGVNLLHFRCAPYRSYAMAVTLKNTDYPQALGYDMEDPYHYYRSQVVNGQQYLIVGGEDHKTGHQENTGACFRNLESHVRKHFDVEEVSYRWSSQYFEPADGLAYIGNLPAHSEDMYVATGYGGNGMIYGTIAGMLLSNIIVHGSSIYQELYDPNRIKPIAGFTNLVKESADVVAHLIKDRFSAEKLNELVEIAAGEAKVVKYEGHTLAIYKDEEGQVHAVNSACTHIKCTVAWNSAEKTWDCPCHGSRFTYDGELLTGPARKDLQKVSMTELIDSGK
jgi:glycine/D-amino acid oxidase-like deaminating enzyme/nitrite reductase/ring-hydroxylating ferredoxin subunit